MHNVFGGEDEDLVDTEEELNEDAELDDDLEQDDEFEEDPDEDGEREPGEETTTARTRQRIDPEEDDVTHAIDCNLDHTCTCRDE